MISRELIFYERADAPGPRRSTTRCEDGDPYTLLEILQHISRASGVVEKVRSLYIVGQTRIHIDK